RDVNLRLRHDVGERPAFEQDVEMTPDARAGFSAEHSAGVLDRSRTGDQSGIPEIDARPGRGRRGPAGLRDGRSRPDESKSDRETGERLYRSFQIRLRSYRRWSNSGAEPMGKRARAF